MTGRAAFLDLSHTITHGMTTYPGLPGPVICDFLSREASRGKYAPGVEFQIGKIEMVANTGHVRGLALPPLRRRRRI